MFNATDDDDFFPTPTSASNLANLFGTSFGSDLNASLTYSAPKQPKNNNGSEVRSKLETESVKPKQSQTKLICVKTIQLFKLADSSYTLIGKYGIAIIGDTNINSYNLIIYQTKQQILSSSKLTPGFKYTELEDNSASFKDEQGQFWKVHFDDAKDFSEFSYQLKTKGVTVEIKVINKVMAEKSDDEKKLDDSDSSGAQARQDILERISKVGQSMLPTINKGVDLSESETEEVIKAKKTVRKPKRHPATEKENNHQAEINEPAQQFMVPVNQNTITQPQYTLINGQYVPTQMMQCMPSQMYALNDPFNIYFAENRTHNSEVRMNLNQLSNKLESVISELSNLRTPAPTENEYLHNKIIELERKLETLSTQKNAEKLNVDNEKSIQTLQQNEVQKYIETINNLEKKLKETEEKLEESLKVQQENSQQVNKLTKQIEDSQKNESNFESEKNKELNEIIETKMSKINELEMLCNENQKVCDKLKQTNQTLEESLSTQTEKNNYLLDEIESLKMNVEERNDKIDILKLKLKDFEEQLQKNCKTDKLQAAKLQEDKIKVFTDMVKQSMNQMYQNILERFMDDNVLNSGDFKRTLSNNMKNATYQILEEYKSSLTEHITNEEDRYLNDNTPPPVPEFEVTV